MAISSSVKVLENAKLRKVRKLLVPGDVLVKTGDVVEPDDVIAKTEFVRGNPRIIDLNAEFHRKLSLEEVDKVLQKKVGDKVTARDVVASYQKNFWSEVEEVFGPCDGTIEYISRTQGRVVVREDPRSAKPMCIVPASAKLSVWPWLIRMFAEVKEGDFVQEGQVLAAAQNIGMMDYVYAPMAGVVEKICPKTGTITIVRPIRPARVVAHIAGRVTEIVEDYGAVVEGAGSYLEGVFGLGGERHGEIAIATGGPAEVLEGSGIKAEHKDKILVAGSFATLEALQKARSVGAKGLVVGGVNNVDLVQVLGKEINAGLTGHEDIGFTVIVMEAFGRMPMNDRAWEVLSAHAGAVASIDGTTQIRAGVIRPQVLVSLGPAGLEAAAGEAVGMAREESRPRAANLSVGDTVRCVREPHPGLRGVVEEIPAEPQRVECEALMEVARVRLDDGRLITVPEANLEVLKPAAS